MGPSFRRDVPHVAKSAVRRLFAAKVCRMVAQRVRLARPLVDWYTSDCGTTRLLTSVRFERIVPLMIREFSMKNRLLYTFVAFSKESALLTFWVLIYIILYMVWSGIRDDRGVDFYIEKGAIMLVLYLGMVVLLAAFFTLAMVSGIGKWGAAYSAFASKDDVFTFVHDEMKNITY